MRRRDSVDEEGGVGHRRRVRPRRDELPDERRQHNLERAPVHAVGEGDMGAADRRSRDRPRDARHESARSRKTAEQ